MSSINETPQSNKEIIPDGRKHGRHARQVIENSGIVSVEEQKQRNYAGFALISFILMVLFAGIHGIISIFNELCPEPSKGSCARIPLGGSFEILEFVFLGLAILFTIAVILFAVEAITRKSRQRIAYTALGLAVFAILIFTSGLYEMVVEKIVLRFI